MAKAPIAPNDFKEYVITYEDVDNNTKSVIVKAPNVYMAVFLSAKKIKLSPITIKVKSL